MIVQGFTIENALTEGVLITSASNVTVARSRVIDNDACSATPNTKECKAAFNQQDDYGEAVHLMSATNSSIVGNFVKDNVGGILLTDELGPVSGNLVLRKTPCSTT